MDEKRVDSRHSVNHEFETLGEFVREYVLNVSRGGAFIRSAEVLPVGTAVRVKFTIVDDDILTIEGEGRVARAHLPLRFVGVLGFLFLCKADSLAH